MKHSLPCKVSIKKLIASRYSDSRRPLDWDRRKSGIDSVETEELGTLPLNSDGSQSPPQPGWVLILTDGDEQAGYRWTLYGLAPSPTVAAAANH